MADVTVWGENVESCPECKGVGVIYAGCNTARPAFPDCPECGGSGCRVEWGEVAREFEELFSDA